jgi:pimeloyl-ACP methyl ester carboxylesterase
MIHRRIRQRSQSRTADANTPDSTPMTSAGPLAVAAACASVKSAAAQSRTPRAHVLDVFAAAPMNLPGAYSRIGMPHETIDGVPIWYEEVGDLAGRPLIALHGGVLTFRRSFDDVLPWLAEDRRVIGVELQGHGHTPDTGRALSFERFADDVAELIDRVANGGPVDVWGFSLGALTATSLALRHPAKVRRIVLSASNIRPDGYHPEITAPEQDDPRLPTEEEFAIWQADYDAVAPNPADFFPFLERLQPLVHDFAGWTGDQIRTITAPTFLVIGDRDFVRLDHAAEMLDLFPDCRLAVLPATRHTEVMQRPDVLRDLIQPFLR